jgi:hypothetical protein
MGPKEGIIVVIFESDTTEKKPPNTKSTPFLLRETEKFPGSNSVLGHRIDELDKKIADNIL